MRDAFAAGYRKEDKLYVAYYKSYFLISGLYVREFACIYSLNWSSFAHCGRDFSCMFFSINFPNNLSLTLIGIFMGLTA